MAVLEAGAPTAVHGPIALQSESEALREPGLPCYSRPVADWLPATILNRALDGAGNTLTEVEQEEAKATEVSRFSVTSSSEQALPVHAWIVDSPAPRGSEGQRHLNVINAHIVGGEYLQTMSVKSSVTIGNAIEPTIRNQPAGNVSLDLS